MKPDMAVAVVMNLFTVEVLLTLYICFFLQIWHQSDCSCPTYSISTLSNMAVVRHIGFIFLIFLSR